MTPEGRLAALNAAIFAAYGTPPLVIYTVGYLVHGSDAEVTPLPDAVYDRLPEWALQMLAHWQACGPWVPDADLDETGRAVKAAFVWMIQSDARYGRWCNCGDELKQGETRCANCRFARGEPQWSSASPTVPGLYFYRQDANHKPEARRVYPGDGPKDLPKFGEWWPVPLEEPPK